MCIGNYNSHTSVKDTLRKVLTFIWAEVGGGREKIRNICYKHSINLVI